MPMPMPITAISRLTGLLPESPSATGTQTNIPSRRMLETVQKNAEPSTEKRPSICCRKKRISPKNSPIAFQPGIFPRLGFIGIKKVKPIEIA